MSTVVPKIPAGLPASAHSYPKHSSASEIVPKQPPSAPVIQAASEHHHAITTTALTAQALSSTDISYVESLMGAVPAQKMEEILLKTGVPIPANLGPNIDTAA